MVSPPAASSPTSASQVIFNDESDSQDNFSDVSDGAVLELADDASTWTFTCPLTTKTFPSKSSLNDFWDNTFNAKLENIVKHNSPLAAAGRDVIIKSQDAFLYYCILINYLRTESRSLQSNKENATYEQSAAREILKNINPDSKFWYDDQYLFPVIPDDPLIRAFDDWNIDAPDDAEESEEDGLQEDPYQENRSQRFIVEGEAVPSQEFLTEQAKSLRDIGAFDALT